MFYLRFRPSSWIPLIGFFLLATHPSFASLKGEEAFEKSFNMVWSTINESFWDEDFNGVDWEGVGDRYRGKLRGVKSRNDLAVLMQSMLNQLGQSHFKILNRSAESFVEAHGGGHTGIHLKYTPRGTYVMRIEPGSVADGAGIQVGWKLKSINGKSVRRIVQGVKRADISEKRKLLFIQLNLTTLINGNAGKRLRTDWYPPTGRAVKIYLNPEQDRREFSEPIGYFAQQRLEYEETYLEDRVLYLRFNFFMPDLMEKIRLVIEAAEGRASGLILDLRGNYGGLAIMASGIAGLLVEEETQLGQLTLRRGHFSYLGYPQDKRFSGPVAILIDGCTVSTSEILAAGLQEAGRARIFGEVSLGESLPSLFKKLPNGDVLQYAVGNFLTPRGYRIENNGVVPDVLIEPDLDALQAGLDSPLQAAMEWLRGEACTVKDDEA